MHRENCFPGEQVVLKLCNWYDNAGNNRQGCVMFEVFAVVCVVEDPGLLTCDSVLLSQKQCVTSQKTLIINKHSYWLILRLQELVHIIILICQKYNVQCGNIMLLKHSSMCFFQFVHLMYEYCEIDLRSSSTPLLG